MKALILAFDPNRPRRQVKDTFALPQTEYEFVSEILELADQIQRLADLDPVTFEALRRLVKRELDSYSGEGGA